MTKFRSIATIALLLVLLLPFLMIGDSGGPPAPESPPIGWRPLLASFLTAAFAAALAVAIGGLFAGLFSLTNFPASGFTATLLVLAFGCPAMVWALAQVYCYGPGGLLERWLGDLWRVPLSWNRGHYLSTTLVLAEIHVPVTCLIIARGVERLHDAGIEAALFQLRGTRRWEWIAGSLRSELVAAFLLVFALGAGNFAVPHLLQCHLYPIELYQRTTNYLDHAGAVRAALPLLMPTLLASGLIAFAERNRTVVRVSPHAPVRIALGRATWLAVGFVGLYLFVTTFLPLAALLYECQSLSHVIATARDAGLEIENTVRISLAAAAVACLAGLATTLDTSRRGRWVTSFLTLLPLGVPSLFVGFAYARFYNGSWPIDLSFLGETSLLVIFALAFRGWPFATRLLTLGKLRLAPEWSEASRLAGVGGLRRAWWLTGPLLATPIAAAATLTFLLSAGDVEISQMLCAPGTGTLSLRLFTFLHFGPARVAAGLAVLQLLIAMLPMLMFLMVSKRHVPIA